MFVTILSTSFPGSLFYLRGGKKRETLAWQREAAAATFSTLAYDHAQLPYILKLILVFQCFQVQLGPADFDSLANWEGWSPVFLAAAVVDRWPL